ncbi:MAG: hypothetical protein KC713_02630, partial [Candidatus Omnitrophica bacterium]|nr:hypothetical protein [Candidatus Omnitrophota bacterium]
MKITFEQLPHKLLICLLFAAAYLLFMLGNGMVSLSHPDEVFYTQSAREMLAHRSWLTPVLFDQVHFEKPFLPFVMIISAIKVFGLSP